MISPELWDTEGVLAAQQELYNYFRDGFFYDKKCFCAALCEDGQYLSFLRMEPYRDGLLLTGLETDRQERSQGFAKTLVGKVLEDLQKHGEGKVYAHIHKSNIASVKVHKACGFTVISDSAKFLDGSFSSKAYTLMWSCD